MRAELVVLPGSPEVAAVAIAECFETYFKAASALEAEAEALADEHLRRGPAGGAGLDRRRVVQMIIEKLARERGFPV